MKSPKRKPAPQRPASLYGKEQRVQLATAGELVAFLEANTPERVLPRVLDDVASLANKARSAGLTDHADELKQRLRALRSARRLGPIQDAILAAIHLGAAFERARTDALLAGPVDAYKRSRSRPTVPDARIRAACEQPTTQADAAAEVGLSVRQFRTRAKALGVTNRKAVRLPPRR